MFQVLLAVEIRLLEDLIQIGDLKEGPVVYVLVPRGDGHVTIREDHYVQPVKRRVIKPIDSEMRRICLDGTLHLLEVSVADHQIFPCLRFHRTRVCLEDVVEEAIGHVCGSRFDQFDDRR